MEKPCGDGERGTREHALVSENAVEKDPARASVSVDEGMYRLELGVSDRRLDNGADVISADKGDKILETALDTLRNGWNEERPMRTVCRPADPHLLVAQLSPERRPRRLDQGAMNGLDLLDRNLRRQSERLSHGRDIALNDARVSWSVVRELGNGDIADARGEVLNLGTRCGLASQQERGQVVATRSLRLIEAGEPYQQVVNAC